MKGESSGHVVPKQVFAPSTILGLESIYKR